MNLSNENPLTIKYKNAIEELKTHYQQLNKYLKNTYIINSILMPTISFR